MYMKRKEKSVNWTVDDTNRRRPSLDAASEDLYYNPAPTKATATWKPKLHDLRAVSLSPLPRLFAPRVPPASEENAKYMSAEEFERMRLFEDKTTHDTVAPQLCFNLAADLRQSASKGGRMFAKRRAKADQWTVENNPLPRSQVTKPVRSRFARARGSQEPHYGEVARPSETQLRRAPMSPWEAAVQFGHVEPAFNHLQHFTSTSSSSSIPQMPSQRQHSQHAVATDLFPTQNHFASAMNGSNHIHTDDDDDESSVTSHSYLLHHQPQHHFNMATSPWQRDVSRTPDSVNGSYRPIHFNVVTN